MTTISKQTTIAVLSKLNHGVPLPTAYLNPLVPPTRPRNVLSHQPSTERTRRFLHKLKAAGLVEGQEGRDGGIRWWKITQAGREFLG